MSVERTLFGSTAKGEHVYEYTIKNNNGITAQIITYGATLRTLFVPDKNGVANDIVLGYDTLSAYEAGEAYLGATIGRVANRIRGGRFCLNDKVYNVEKNNGDNHLHGGGGGFHRRVWGAQVTAHGVALMLYSPHMDGGYPGGLSVTVRYSLYDDNTLHIAYTAVSDAKTLLNLTNHSYFNLRGQGEGDMLGHALQINARYYTPADSQCVTTGEIHSVDGTPMDFTSPKLIGRDINANFEQMGLFGGYDHNFVLDEGAKAYRQIAKVFEPESGRAMSVLTDMPGVQLYTSNGMHISGKGGATFDKYSAFCLETQYFPDCVNHAHFKGPVLEADTLYKSETAYSFLW